MPRTIVYPPVQKETVTFGGPGGGSAKRPSTEVDGYAEKLTKYIPAEVIAFFAPIASVLASRVELLWSTAAIGVIATPAYLFLSAKSLPREKQPRPHFYILSVVAFIVWALATSALGKQANLDPISTSFLLGVTVFLLPAVDGLAEHFIYRPHHT
jgi:hypothetical protein